MSYSSLTQIIVMGGRQAGKAPGFGPGIRRFESFPPSHFADFAPPVGLRFS